MKSITLGRKSSLRSMMAYLAKLSTSQPRANPHRCRNRRSYPTPAIWPRCFVKSSEWTCPRTLNDCSTGTPPESGHRIMKTLVLGIARMLGGEHSAGSVTGEAVSRILDRVRHRIVRHAAKPKLTLNRSLVHRPAQKWGSCGSFSNSRALASRRSISLSSRATTLRGGKSASTGYRTRFIPHHRVSPQNEVKGMLLTFLENNEP